MFDYSEGPNGPSHWGELKTDWAICKSGLQQSPLSITPNLIVTDSTLGNLKANYTSGLVNATISHSGDDFKVTKTTRKNFKSVSHTSFLYHEDIDYVLLYIFEAM